MKIRSWEGSTRVVFKIGSYVVKIPQFRYEWRHFLYGLIANIQEVQFWKAYQHKKLCPILFWFPLGLLLVMPYAEPISREEFFKINLDEWTYTEYFIIPVESKLNSFGMYQGKIVAVDYGS